MGLYDVFETGIHVFTPIPASSQPIFLISTPPPHIRDYLTGNFFNRSRLGYRFFVVLINNALNRKYIAASL